MVILFFIPKRIYFLYHFGYSYEDGIFKTILTYLFSSIYLNMAYIDDFALKFYRNFWNWDWKTYLEVVYYFLDHWKLQKGQDYKFSIKWLDYDLSCMFLKTDFGIDNPEWYVKELIKSGLLYRPSWDRSRLHFSIDRKSPKEKRKEEAKKRRKKRELLLENIISIIEENYLHEFHYVNRDRVDLNTKEESFFLGVEFDLKELLKDVIIDDIDLTPIKDKFKLKLFRD